MQVTNFEDTITVIIPCAKSEFRKYLNLLWVIILSGMGILILILVLRDRDVIGYIAGLISFLIFGFLAYYYWKAFYWLEDGKEQIIINKMNIQYSKVGIERFYKPINIPLNQLIAIELFSKEKHQRKFWTIHRSDMYFNITDGKVFISYKTESNVERFSLGAGLDLIAAEHLIDIIEKQMK
jgi:retron-type reverse transcriptase